jgi:hypothetical protein
MPNQPQGEDHPNARLTEDDVLEIYDRIDDGQYFSDIAAAFGVTQECISMIHHHKRWAHVAEAVHREAPPPPRRIPESTKRRIAQMARTPLYREIAEQFGLSAGTVASIVARQREAGAA